MLKPTRGHYQTPARKTAMDILMTMRAQADNTTKKMMLAMRADEVLLSISGMCFRVSCYCHCHKLSHL